MAQTPDNSRLDRIEAIIERTAERVDRLKEKVKRWEEQRDRALSQLSGLTMTEILSELDEIHAQLRQRLEGENA